MSGHRGLYNSAWIGASTAILCALFLSIAGFYLGRRSVDNDRRSRVEAILGTTPMSRLEYTLANPLPHHAGLDARARAPAALAARGAGVAAGAAAIELGRGEDRRLDLLAIAAPFAWIVLPAMAIAAGAAVLFETLPGLRGGLGNVVFFFGWIAAIGTAETARVGSAGPLGIQVLVSQMMGAAGRPFPDGRADPGAA